MATWEYRIIRHEGPFSIIPGEPEWWYGIHEVYYDEGSQHPTSWTQNPVVVISNDLSGMQWILQRMLEALAKPTLKIVDNKLVEVQEGKCS